MEMAEIEICRFAEDLWGIVLGLPVRRSVGMAIPSDDTLTGTVYIRGTWRGAVVLEVPERLVREAAAKMFGVGVPAVAPGDALDCLRELTNIIAGNVKALFPGPSSLGLPMVSHGPAESVPGTTIVTRVAFKAASGDFFVTVVRDGTGL